MNTFASRQRTPPRPSPGLHYDPRFVEAEDRREIIDWLKKIHPIWEDRYSEHRPPPPGRTQRKLLRPVCWLGSWQFACLDYYRPPVADFETRRVNFTFRWVPEEHIVPYAALHPEARRDVRRYVEELARHSAFFAKELAAAPEVRA